MMGNIDSLSVIAGIVILIAGIVLLVISIFFWPVFFYGIIAFILGVVILVTLKEQESIEPIRKTKRRR